jgi:hypothetical protein
MIEHGPLGVNPRSTKAVIKLFLKKGFTGKGGAIKLAGNKSLSAAEVAAAVQGNKNGASDYANFSRKAAAIMSATNFRGGSGGGGGATGTPVEIPTHGAVNTLDNRLAEAQGRLDFAGTTTRNFTDDINAIYGYDTPVRRRGVNARFPNRRQGSGNINPRRAKRTPNRKGGRTVGSVGPTTGGLGRNMTRGLPRSKVTMVHHEGMLDVLNTQDDRGRKRLKTINAKLKGRLTKERRASLLEEKANIHTSIAGNKVKKRELRTQAAEAGFERSQGGNARIYNEDRTARAATTAGLGDDIAAAKAEATYYQNREAFLRKRGDITGATEARNAYNSASKQVQDYTDQINEAGLSFRTSKASMTKTLTDDLALAKEAQGYWQYKVNLALAAGDIVGANEAQQNLASASESIKNITDQIREEGNKFKENALSLRDQAAGFTGTLTDDLSVANDSLKYWRDRLKDAQKRGDTEDIFTAQTNINQYTETAKNLKEDMKRLPLERDAALATLTEDTQDDTKAAIALRDYWTARLADAKKNNDLSGQIEAAGNIKGLNDQIKDAQSNIATQMVLLSEARRDLYKNFGSNFIPTLIQGVQSYTPSQQYPGVGGTTVNLTVNGATLATDPHTWSQGVAWEIQAAV